MDEPAAEATRVRFRERQVLRAADLSAEQDYRVAMRRRHNTGQHGWGIVRGLELGRTPDGPDQGQPPRGLFVRPGMAVDGYGRELLVHEPFELPLDAFERLSSRSLDVWLVYDLDDETTPQRGRRACAGRGDRRREVSRVRLTRVRPATQTTPAQVIDPRTPAEVSTDDLGFGPHLPPPDDPARAWPVYLGRIIQIGVAGSFTYATPNASRPYATLKGELLTAASGLARVQVGSELEDDTRRFAVGVADASGAFTDRLALDREGKTTVRGNTTFGGRLLMRENKAAAQPGQPNLPPECAPATRPDKAGAEGAARAVTFLPLAETPKAAAPWKIYRTSVVREGRSVRQLRVEIGNPGDQGDPALYKLTIGSHRPNGGFDPCLTVTADCLVTVAANLEVKGNVIEASIKADPSDPRFAAELVNQFEKGVAAGGSDTIPELELKFIDCKQQKGDAPPVALSKQEMEVNHKLSYTLRVKNIGHNLITGLQVYESITFFPPPPPPSAPPPAASPPPRTTRRTYPASPFSLAAAEAEDFAQTYEPGPGAGRILIAVTVTGVGAVSNVLWETAQTTVNVVEPKPPGN